MEKCAFLGLGTMGFPMAGHLSVAGYAVRAWNRSSHRAQHWAELHKGDVGESIKQSVADADYVLMCLGDDPDVLAVAGQAIASMKRGAILIDHTTASAECARRCYADAKAAGLHFLDAPISGGEAGAQQASLTIMCGGERDIFDKSRHIMSAYGNAMTYMGESGAGQLTKSVNQICIAGLLQGLAEGLNFAQRSGLEVEAVIQAIGKGAAQSWQMDNRALTMAKDEYDFGFALDWMRKDLRIALEQANKIDAKVTVTKLVDSYYAELQERGCGRMDTSALLKLLT